MSPESTPLRPSPTQATQQWRQQQPEIEGDYAEREEDILEHLQYNNNNGPTHHPSAPPDELFDIATTVDPSYIISLIRKLLPVNDKQGDDSEGSAPFSPKRNGDVHSSNGHVDAMDIQNGVLGQSPRSSDCPKMSTREEAWEESGCILWDLAANEEHAEFMAQNLVVDVLLANLLTTDSVRVTEISLGIIGNLACHEVVMNEITTTNRFLETIANQVYSNDTPCLCEVCRLLTLGLQGCQSIEWAKALQSDNIISRVLWIAENTLNPTLTEKSVGMLLAIMENQQVVPILLPTLVKLGLPRLLISLLAFEMGKLSGDRMPERYAALESILRTIETLSVIDDYSEEICSNKEVVEMAVELIKFPEKIEISSSCVTAAVLVANVLADAPDLALELSKDLFLLQSFLDLFPFTSDDLEARNALWNVLARLLLRVKDIEMSSLHQYVWTFVSRLGLIEDALLDSECDKSSGNEEISTTVRTNLSSRTTAVSYISVFV
ncbi:hypothetical protein KSS87_013987 [Heliosperma pusillum]|nr:hypothetical protein KSS87_013987 [Heliosperma pusillum]